MKQTVYIETNDVDNSICALRRTIPTGEDWDVIRVGAGTDADINNYVGLYAYSGTANKWGFVERQFYCINNLNEAAGKTLLSATLKFTVPYKNKNMIETPSINIYNYIPIDIEDPDSPVNFVGAGNTAYSTALTYNVLTATNLGNQFIFNTVALAALQAAMASSSAFYFCIRDKLFDVDGGIPNWSATAHYVVGIGETWPRLEIYCTDETSLILELAFNQSIFTVAPTWTDVSADLMKLNIKRGRMHELDRIEAGTAVFTLDNSDGNWWRYNTTGAFYVAASAEVVKPLTLIRYSVTYAGITYRRFYGVVEKFKHSWLEDKGYHPIVELPCVDLFKSLARLKLQALTSTTGIHTNVGIMASNSDAAQKLIVLNSTEDISRLHVTQLLTVGDDLTTEVNYIDSIAVNTLTLTMHNNLANNYTTANHGYVKKFPAVSSNGRILDILSELGWPSSLTSLATGKVIVIEYVPPAGGTSGLEHLQDVVEAEGGLFFIARDGIATLQDRDYRRSLSSSTVFSDDGTHSHYVLPDPIDDDDLIFNEAHVLGDGISEQIIRDATSQSTQGARVVSRTESLIYSDNDAFDQAWMIVQRFKDSQLRCQTLLIYPDADPTDLYPKVLAYDLSTRITLELNSTQNPALINKGYHIEGIEENWSRLDDRYEVTWQLWDVNQYQIVRAEHDGYLYGENAVYATAHDLAVGTVKNDDTVVAVGQSNEGTGISDDFWIWRGFVQFDTTGIIAANVLSAIILVKIYGYYIIDNQIYIIVVSPSTLANPLVATDYAVLHGSTSAWGTSTLITTPDINTSWLIISLTQDAINTINVAGTTKFGLRSNRDISTTTPGTPGPLREWIAFYGVGSSAVPRLIVTFKPTI